MSAVVVSLTPRFDPTDPGAEARYDSVVSRLNRVSALRQQARRACAELERQFVEDDLVVRSGPRRGRPLTTAGRRQRLRALLERTATLRALEAERTRLLAELDAMNRALDAWAREHWGADGHSQP